MFREYKEQYLRNIKYNKEHEYNIYEHDFNIYEYGEHEYNIS